MTIRSVCTRVGMELDDVCGVAVLFDCLHAHAGVLRAFAHIRHPLQPVGTTTRLRISTIRSSRSAPRNENN